ncbi:glycosidase [Galbibacter sp. BG1]|uniref:glycoside hydrolase family 130 protein n=1 Tax=Galbibacter sp. BG1 TaxID=1170699 RepID=UPI0021048353|nr:glycosidase [Galbibacter sp. BG1]
MIHKNATRKIKNYESLMENYKSLIERKNIAVPQESNLFTRYKYPIVTAKHIPISWRFDLNVESNPFGLERIGVNAAFNAGAIKWKGKYVLAVRVEGNDRKSYFAFAESDNGIDNFKFWNKPLLVPENDEEDINVYDIRLTAHEDGYVYGVFCTEKKDPNAPAGDTSAAIANAGIIRSKNLEDWERLPNLISPSNQQRNVVLHPEFVDGKYALYTRPQDGFIETGAGGGIGLGFIEDMANPAVKEEVIVNNKEYHTVYELKNGLGPAPIKTEKGWLHLAHGVRNTAAGLRYVLYLFMTDLDDITKITHFPGGYFMAPNEQEIIGDVSNVLFCNGWIADDNGKVFIYYASSDTRMHLATTSIEVLVDYCMNTPSDGLASNKSVENIIDLIDKNAEII